MEKVLVLMSTYNGEKYLREQLDSICGQNDVDIHILIRDDGSEDTTLQILEEYKNKYSNITILAEQNIGAALSFYELMFKADQFYKDYNYYAFADQDDYWFPDKLKISLELLNSSSCSYKLFYSAVTETDANLNPIKTTGIQPSTNLNTNIVSSRALGCTMVFNKHLLKKACVIFNYLNQRQGSDYLPYHDGWLSLVAYALNGKVVVSSQPLMYYRQHGGNVIGSGKSKFKLIKDRLIRYIKNSENEKSKKCQLVLNLLGNDIPPENRQIISTSAYYKDSLKNWVKLLCSKSIYNYGIIDNIGTFGVILCKKF